MRVRLSLPAPEKDAIRKLGVQAEYQGFDECIGTVIAGAGAAGAWVRFDGQPSTSYVGCPVRHLYGVN